MIVVEYVEVSMETGCTCSRCAQRRPRRRCKLTLWHAQSWPSLVADDRLGLLERVQLARNAVDLMRLFDTFPVRNGATTQESPVVFVESGGRSFGATGNYDVKLFALAGQLRFRKPGRGDT